MRQKAFALLMFVVSIPTVAATKRNPYEGSEAAKRAGAKLYARQCAACHGKNREGRDRTPALGQPNVTHLPDEALFRLLTDGNIPKGMPSFAQLPKERRWQIVTFLKEQP